MNRNITILFILLLVAHLLPECATAFHFINPVAATSKVNPWLDHSYTFYDDPSGIVTQWFVKYVCDDLFNIITYGVMCIIAAHYSFRLFRIVFVYFLYHCFDHFMLWYDYKTGYKSYWGLLVLIIIVTFLIRLPDKKQGVVKAIK